MTRFMACLFAFVCPVFVFAQATSPLNQSAPPAAKRNSAALDIGLNALMLYQNSNRGNRAYSEERNGFSLQEAELQFSSDVDPYWRFVGTFALHQEVEVDDTTAPPTRTAEYVFEPEEAYGESLDLPFVTLRVGKFKAAFGKHNQLHTHGFAFVDAPLANAMLLGDEGLNDVGVSASALLPLPWFSELTLQGFSGQGEGLDYFQPESANSNVAVMRFRNLWDLTGDLTLDFGVSGANGENTAAKTTNLYGGDLTLKWKGSQSRALIWSTEYIQRDHHTVTEERGMGIASSVQWQFGQRWWAQVRGENLEISRQDPAAADPLPDSQKKQSLLVGYIPSEFSGLRLQYDRLDDGATDDEQKISLQFSYSIGAHPAHAY